LNFIIAIVHYPLNYSTNQTTHFKIPRIRIIGSDNNVYNVDEDLIKKKTFTQDNNRGAGGGGRDKKRNTQSQRSQSTNVETKKNIH